MDLFKVEKRPLYWQIKNIGYIDLVCVDKQYRKSGAAKAPFDQAYKVLQKKGISYVRLQVNAHKKIAHPIWERFSFKVYMHDMYKKL